MIGQTCFEILLLYLQTAIYFRAQEAGVEILGTTVKGTGKGMIIRSCVMRATAVAVSYARTAFIRRLGRQYLIRVSAGIFAARSSELRAKVVFGLMLS